MRALAASLVLLVAACGDDGGNSPSDGGTDGADEPDADDGPPFRGFELKTVPTTVAAGGVESTVCFYFQTPNTEPMAITKWSSSMTAGSHHMIMYLTPTPVMPPGTQSSSNCGFDDLAVFDAAPVWTYGAQTTENALAFPLDDGAGLPVAQLIPPGSYGFIQMHFQNFGDAPVTAETTITAEALPAAQAYTPTAAFVTFDSSIQINPNQTNALSQSTCTTPPGAKFWSMTTHAHKQAIRTDVRAGMPSSTEIAFQSTDWEHPGVEVWSGAPFYSFTDNKLSVTCTYNNPTGRTIRTGDDPTEDEQCMASGYYFPATQPTFCACSGAGAARSCTNYP